jgi:hypothetical protein
VTRAHWSDGLVRPAFPVFALLSLRADGTPDPTCGVGGLVTTPTRSFHTRAGRSFVAVDARGRTVVAGVADRSDGVDLLLAHFLR